jgi:hypothetical protein
MVASFDRLATDDCRGRIASLRQSAGIGILQGTVGRFNRCLKGKIVVRGTSSSQTLFFQRIVSRKHLTPADD